MRRDENTNMGNEKEKLLLEEYQWQEIDETKLTMAERCVYRNRRRALELFQNGSPSKDIFRITGVTHGAILRLWKRCCSQNPETGVSYGYEGLIPRSKMKKFIR